MIKFSPSPKYDKSAAIILIDADQIKKKTILHIRNNSVNAALTTLIKAKQFNAEKNEIFPMVIDKQTVLFVGLGAKKELKPKYIKIAVKASMRSAFIKKVKDVEIVPNQQTDAVIKAIIEGIIIGTYSWRKYITPSKKNEIVYNKEVSIVATKKKSYEDTITIASNVNYTRDLVNDNADTITSEYFEKEITKLVKGQKNAALTILGRKELKSKGLNLHLAVNQGSNKEPKLIIVKYSGAKKTAKYTALIGKGITFDSGGLNLKLGTHMETMRCDMSGSGTVLGVLRNAIELKLKKNVLFVFGLAENAIGKGAYKPGDVIKSYSGKTVEIGNTDAEGRLVLADALSYIGKNYKPSKMIDIATLTGACVVALGYDYTGLVTPDDTFARKLVRASNESDDKAWRLPSYPELKDCMKSNIADIKNISNMRGAGGTITAAEFLRQFTGGITWAHLDIAGTAFLEGSGRSYFDVGATGSAVRLLTEYLKNN